METRHPVGGTFSHEFSAFVIIAELWWPEVARPENFVRTSRVFVKKTTAAQTVATVRIVTKNLPGPAPHIWLTLFQISSKSVHFGQSYCRMHEERFCPVQYLQHWFFEPIMIAWLCAIVTVATVHLWQPALWNVPMSSLWPLFVDKCELQKVAIAKMLLNVIDGC